MLNFKRVLNSWVMTIAVLRLYNSYPKVDIDSKHFQDLGIIVEERRGDVRVR